MPSAIPRHIIFTWQKIKDKEKNPGRENAYRESKIRIIFDLSSDYAKKEDWNILKVWERKTKQAKQTNLPGKSEFCLLQNLAFKSKGRKKTYLTKKNLNVFLVTFHNLGEMNQFIDRHNLKLHNKIHTRRRKIHTRRNR